MKVLLHQSLPSYLSVQKQLVCLSNPSDDSLSLDYRRVAVCLHRSRRFDMVLGNAVALAQTSMKRMLAYSSIAQAGFIMIGLISGTEAGMPAWCFGLPVHELKGLSA